MKAELKNLEIHKKSNEKPNHPVYALGCNSNGSDDEDKDVCDTEFVRPSCDKPCTYGSLKPIHKKQQDNVKYTFDIFKCDRISDELLSFGHIKLSHGIPPLDELK